jgi:tetratricopeptide (TPR) repeat protein
MPETEVNDTQPSLVKWETQPTSVKSDTQPRPAAAPVKKFPRWMAALAVVLLLVLGGLAGYGSGMGQRYDAQSTQVAGQLQEQFDLGIQAMDAGQYEVAKQHFEFIIENDANFPGVMEAYAELLLRMQTSPTPTFTLTPTVTPTPDLRGVEAIYANIRADLIAHDWDAALAHLDSLRKADPNYLTAEVDSLYYLALRMRGYEKIIPPSLLCSDINLEGGIYDLTLAERFGTLDSSAEALRTYARLYIIAASFWDQDWLQAQAFFDQVRAGYDLRDSSCMSASERWRYATIKIAERLLEEGDVCGAEEQFNLAFTISSTRNEEFYPTATEVANQCDGGNGGGEPPPPEGTPTETPTPTDTPPTTSP